MWTSTATSYGITTDESSKVRPLDSIILQAISNKRPKPMQSSRDETAMDIDNNNIKAGNARTMHPDDILKEMVRSGNYSQEHVVEFCIEMNIPLSRMLRLDLMRSTKSGSS